MVRCPASPGRKQWLSVFPKAGWVAVGISQDDSEDDGILRGLGFSGFGAGGGRGAVHAVFF